MKTSDLFQESYSALTVNKARTALTMLGIIIGIGSVIAMVAIGQGAKDAIQANIASIGSNLISVSPGAQRGVGTFVSSGLGSSQTLTQEDVDALRSGLTQISALDGELSRRYQVTAKGTNTNTQVIGTDSNYPAVHNLNMDSGSFITDQQVANMSKVAVIGPTVWEDLFGTSTPAVGQTIRISGQQFKVVGVTQSKGGSGFANQDDMIFIPISVAQHYLAGPNADGKLYVSAISVSAQNPGAMDAVQQQVTNILLQRHNIGNPASADFTVQNQADIVSAASSVTNTFTMLLASIAGISLLVGGIGIMNMMLTTVTERTREIGLRKSIGATRHDISLQFLTEAVLLTFLGGGIGILFGWLLSLLMTHFTGTQTAISAYSVMLAFGVSAGIGLLFGYYPARRASRLNPIEALRFE
ncbi:MAG: ABC transporter permease [Patescibacteria group bacterium]|nr:ABC transporter permease [Patescibacteria group bacterium]